MTTTADRIARLERVQASHGRQLTALKERDAERERDIEESEDRLTLAIADLKADIKALDAKLDKRLELLEATIGAMHVLLQTHMHSADDIR